MPRRSTFNTIVAMAAGAATAAAVVQYTRQKRAAMATVSRDSQMIDTQLGPAEIAIMGDGPAVLISHGVLSGYDQALLIGKPLAEAGYQVIALSRPGYLRTPPIKDMSFKGQADFLAAVLDALKVKKAAIMGVSGGGPTAVEFATRYADRCEALLLLCAVSQRLVTDPEKDPFMRTMFHASMDYDFLAWASVQVIVKTLPLMALAEPGGWRARTMARPDRRAMFERVAWSLFPASLRQPGTRSDIDRIEKLDGLPHAQVAAPTLVMHGTADAIVPFSHGENSANRIKGAEFVPIPGGDHTFFVSHDDIVWPQALAFLQRSATPAKPARKPAARKSAQKVEPDKQPRPATPRRKPPSASTRPTTSSTGSRRRRPAGGGE